MPTSAWLGRNKAPLAPHLMQGNVPPTRALHMHQTITSRMHLFTTHATKFAPNRQANHGPTMAKAGITPERNPLVCVSPRDAIPRQEYASRN